MRVGDPCGHLDIEGFKDPLVPAGVCTFDFTGHKVAKTRILSKWLTKLTHLCCVLSLF